MTDIKSVTTSFTLELPHPASVFAITLDGVLPLSFVRNYIHVIDRNLLSKISSQGASSSDKYWISQIDSPHVTVTPIFCALEGTKRRVPTLDEYISEFQQAQKTIATYLPNAKLVGHTESTLSKSYGIVVDFDARNARETNFLALVAPLLSSRVSTQRLYSTEQEILKIATDHGINLGSFRLLVALSCLYESSDSPIVSPGRGIFRPSGNYTPEDAHNCLSDLRALEMLLVSASFELGSIAFVTRDKPLGRLWELLEPRATEPIDGKATAKISINQALMPRIDDNGLNRLKSIFDGQRSN